MVGLAKAHEAVKELDPQPLSRRELYDRIADLLGSTPPKDLETCLDLLGDDRVQMEITVQQMAFAASSGAWLLRVP